MFWYPPRASCSQGRAGLWPLVGGIMGSGSCLSTAAAVCGLHVPEGSLVELS